MKLELLTLFVVVCSALPLSQPSNTLNVFEDLEMEALVAIQKSDSPGKFKNFVPLVNHVVVYTSAILPSLRAQKEHKHNSEMTETLLLQTFSDAAGLKREIEQSLPTADSILDAMIALGNVMGGSSGYNPVLMMSNVIGKQDMSNMIDEIMKFPLRFPDPDEKQLIAAEQVVLTVGLGFGDQDYAINHFIDSLSDTQKGMLDSLEKNVVNKTLDAMMTPSGDPSPALLEEIKRQMREMEKRKGSTEMMPDEFKDLVREVHVPMDLEQQAQLQALVAVRIGDDASGQFKNFLPLVGQVVTYCGAVLPSIRASKQHTSNHDLSASVLVQTIAEASGSQQPVSDVEKYLPTGEDMLDAMVKLGRVMAGKDGFNPVQMMTNIVGENDMKAIIDEVMHFPLRFPDITDTQLVAAESVALTVGLGVVSQDQALNAFYNTLTDEQKQMVDSLQKNVIEKVVNSMMLPNGDPSPKLIEEIKREMREMKEATGNTNAMPPELKQLVRDSANSNTDELAQLQALVAVHGAEAVGSFDHFLPLVRQVVVYSSAVLPGLRSRKDHSHNSELTSSMLVQTFSEAAGARPSNDSLVAEIEKALPTSDDILAAMVALGNVMGGSSGYNPMQMLSNVIGSEKLSHAIDLMIHFPLRFPDLTDDQLSVAEEVALSVGLGFINQEQAVDRFVAALTPEQKAMLDSLEKDVFDTIVDSLQTPDGKPTPALVEEIKRQMREMVKTKGSTDLMPQDLKDMVSPKP